jgi:HK97 family phage major capsid protein
MIGDFSSDFLPPEMSGPIFEQAARVSVAMQLMRQVPLGINGKNIPTITGRPTAAWVNEGEKKPATKTTLGLKNMVPKKLAAIGVMSKETVRANPGGYVQIFQNQLAEAFGIAFDEAVLHGTNTPFAAYLDQTSKSVELGQTTQANGGVYGDFVTALDLVVSDTSAISGANPSPVRRKVTGFAIDTVVEPNLLGQTDTTGRPLFVDTANGAPPNTDRVMSVGSLLGRRTVMADYVATDDLATVVGYGGDWTQAVWGVTSGITYRTTDQATVTINNELVSCFENNLIAILAEAEYGFLINDLNSFVRIKNATGS